MPAQINSLVENRVSSLQEFLGSFYHHINRPLQYHPHNHYNLFHPDNQLHQTQEEPQTLMTNQESPIS